MGERLDVVQTVAELRGTGQVSAAAADFIRDLDAELRASRAEVERLRAALEEIAKGAGPFSRDQLTFAEGVIEQSKRLAREALARPGEVEK